MKRLAFFIVLAIPGVASAADKDPVRILEPGQVPQDSRLGKAKTLNDYFPFTPPTDLKTWEARKKDLREQVLVANGLWPMPEPTPLNPVIHGKIDKEGYTIEKVFFASYPGHYVSGNLYRPKASKPEAKLPAILSPHGHWKNGRFFEETKVKAEQMMKLGGEKTMEGATYPLQARSAQLARMGCVVFLFDMPGYADSTLFQHDQGLRDADADLRLQSFMGLQTYNSIRALDFLLSLPDVDPTRIGVTGASGGGTQTFILCAIDDRPAAAFPAVMVSTAMQGGGICENAPYLRQATGNIELAGLFAPKPLGMTGAKDWTVDIETKGLPELKALYKLHGALDRVMAKCFPEFPHNYNQVSREVMYNFFNKYLKLNLPEPVVEQPFVPVPPKELSVYDEKHPLPKDATGADRLRQKMAEMSDKQIEALLPRDAKSFQEYQRVTGAALRVMIGDRLPSADAVEMKEISKAKEADGVSIRKLFLGRKGAGEQIPTLELRGKEFDGTIVVWVHPAGKSSLFHDGKLVPAAQEILNKKAAILAPDVLLTGEFEGAKEMPINDRYAGFTFGYNRPLLANRVHDILTTVAFAKGEKDAKAVHLVGWDKAGPWVLLARGLGGDGVGRTAADFDQFRFDKVRTTTDQMMLPGALKYGGLPALAAVSAPGELYVHNHSGTGSGKWLKAAYQATGQPGRLVQSTPKADPDKVIAWLLR